MRIFIPSVHVRAPSMAAALALVTMLVVGCGGGSGSDAAKVAVSSSAMDSADTMVTTEPMKRTTSAATTTMNTAAADTWTSCSLEHGTCTFSGTHNVKYGTDTAFYTRVATNSIACNNETFGDPAVGDWKTCSFDSAAVVAPATTAGASTASTTAAAATDTWTSCSLEHGTCKFSGTQSVKYGTDTAFYTRVATSSIGCNNETFGDPAVGAWKTCSVSAAAAVASESTTGTVATTTATAAAVVSTGSTPVVSVSVPGSVGPYGQDASAYTLAFQDEFEGSSLDTNKWVDHIWYEGSDSTTNYGVSGGSLKIWPQRNASGQFIDRHLVTDKKYYQTYGYYEMEAKVPMGAGSWPAFWLLNSDTPESGSPEIDMIETYSGDPTGYWADSSKRPIRYGTNFFQNGANHAGLSKMVPLLTGDLSAGFHKYAVKWDPTKLSFYFDGVLVASHDVTMTRRMYILLSLQFGSASGEADNSTPTGPANAFEVKYVRAWSLK